MTRPSDLLTGQELSPDQLEALLERAAWMKVNPLGSEVLKQRTVALIFQRHSTRTRVTFETGIVELGGHPMVLRTEDTQLARGESIRDTAYVLSRNVAAIGIRTGPDELVEELAKYATVPVINMLTAGHHPCQAFADLLTLKETFGDLKGLKLAYVGDGNNVARSLAIVGSLAGVKVSIAAPDGYQLEPVAGAHLTWDPYEAVKDANAVYTDVWVSMNDDPETAGARIQALQPYQLNDDLLAAAAPGAIAMHDLPAHPGEEITESVLYGERQRIWDQAENRRHTQKAVLELLCA
ncbi:MAG TPA: ornithine carbamoyltransferase [Solirubrobacteraceae bacterium]|jgi:ornithine carbamoyltransferase|nr:ornithine carbamoyltransferase [Solirubrobacteraceae bacterium]